MPEGDIDASPGFLGSVLDLFLARRCELRHARFLRPPFGARNAAVLDAARRRGLRVVLWSAMLDETGPTTDPGALAERLLRQVGDGAILVLHDGHRGRADRAERTYEAGLAPRLIAALKARGYGFVTVAQLVAEKGGK